MTNCALNCEPWSLDDGGLNRAWPKPWVCRGPHSQMPLADAVGSLLHRLPHCADGLTVTLWPVTGWLSQLHRRTRMRPDRDRDAARERLALQVLDGCEKHGLRVWQQFGSAYVGRPIQNRLVRAPRCWERVVEALSYEIACLLDYDCGWGCTVERVPSSDCLLYRPARWYQVTPAPAIPSGLAAA